MPELNPPVSLIVGASGQLGTALIHQLGPAALPAARRQLHPDWLHIDLAGIAANPALLDPIFAQHNIAAVYCAAGATDVERCESDHAWAAAANHLGPLALARAARNIPFAFFSTDYIFDGLSGPYLEDAPTNPLSFYGRTKLQGEQSILAEHANALILRTTTVYGPDPQAKNFLYTLRRLLTPVPQEPARTMRVPTDQFATPTHVEDLATASIALVQGGHTGIFHIAGPDFLSRYDFALQACDILNLDASLILPLTTPELNQKAARPLLGGLGIAKLNATLGPGLMRPPSTGIRDWQEASA